MRFVAQGGVNVRTADVPNGSEPDEIDRIVDVANAVVIFFIVLIAISVVYLAIRLWSGSRGARATLTVAAAAQLSTMFSGFDDALACLSILVAIAGVTLIFTKSSRAYFVETQGSK